MNGGNFPIHAEHKHGMSIDAHFAGYNIDDNPRDKDNTEDDLTAYGAKKLVEFLKDPNYGPRIAMVYAEWDKNDKNDPFYKEIQDAEMTDRFTWVSHHDTHFHWNFI